MSAPYDALSVFQKLDYLERQNRDLCNQNNEQQATIAGLKARVSIARQAFNVVYNCKGAPEQWERGKRILIELQEQYDGIVPLAADSVNSSNRHEVEHITGEHFKDERMACSHIWHECRQHASSTCGHAGCCPGFWVPEHPRMPMYRAIVPHRTGKLGEVEHLLTASIHSAMKFPTREACEAWIAANPHPVFVARGHSIMAGASDAATKGPR